MPISRREQKQNGKIPTKGESYERKQRATVRTALQNGEKVKIPGFGIFEIRNRSARVGKNPQTGETVRIPASKAPVFKAGKALKDAVNK